MNSRRRFIRESLAGSAAIGLSASLPNVLLSASRQASAINDEKILVVVQLSGGNDGLNTVVPYADDDYYKNRFTLAVGRQNVIKINDQIGIHPALRPLYGLIEDGAMAVAQGVGYPNPNRSHFESMDLWHSAHRIDEQNSLGWLGRSVQQRFMSNDLPAVHFGKGVQPLALRTETKPIATIRSLEDFQLRVARDAKIRDLVEPLIKSDRRTENSLLSYVHESSKVALSTSHRLEGLSDPSSNEYGFPGSRLGRNLRIVARLIESGLPTKIYYTTLDGFDTHSNQGPSHQGLLNDFSTSLNAFMKQLADQGNDKRVVVLAFSEFGRRVRENASQGTDHGTAAPVFVFGSAVSKSVYGEHPSLQDLDQGDLKFSIDYRSIYADLLKNWLSVDPEPILAGSYEPLGLFERNTL